MRKIFATKEAMSRQFLVNRYRDQVLTSPAGQALLLVQCISIQCPPFTPLIMVPVNSKKKVRKSKVSKKSLAQAFDKRAEKYEWTKNLAQALVDITFRYIAR